MPEISTALIIKIIVIAGRYRRWYSSDIFCEKSGIERHWQTTDAVPTTC